MRGVAMDGEELRGSSWSLGSPTGNLPAVDLDPGEAVGEGGWPRLLGGPTLGPGEEDLTLGGGRGTGSLEWTSGDGDTGNFGDGVLRAPRSSGKCRLSLRDSVMARGRGRRSLGSRGWGDGAGDGEMEEPGR